MKKYLLAVAALALVFPATATAKGPAAAKVEGPRIDGALTFGGRAGSGEPGSRAPLGRLTEAAGLFPAMFEQTPDPMLARRPDGDVGPKYTITWQVPGPAGTDTIRQDVYPYATPAPLTYTKPGQRFFGSDATRGGWFVADPSLKETLVAAGLPAATPAAGPDRESWFAGSPPALWIGAVALVLASGGAAVLLARRRPRPAGAA